MKKAIALMALLFLIGLVSTAHAMPVRIYSTDLISRLSVNLGSGYQSLRAGEFKFVLNPGAADEYETVSYCIDPFETFRSGRLYTDAYQILPAGKFADDIYGPNFSLSPDKVFEAAFLMRTYAVAFNGPLMDYSAKDTAGGLQLAIWKTLLPALLVGDDQSGDIKAVYDAINAGPAGRLSEDFFVA